MNRKKILCIADPDFSQLIRLMLEHEGIDAEFHSATTASEGLDIAQKLEVDLIFLIWRLVVDYADWHTVSQIMEHKILKDSHLVLLRFVTEDSPGDRPYPTLRGPRSYTEMIVPFGLRELRECVQTFLSPS